MTFLVKIIPFSIVTIHRHIHSSTNIHWVKRVTVGLTKDRRNQGMAPLRVKGNRCLGGGRSHCAKAPAWFWSSFYRYSYDFLSGFLFSNITSL